MTRIPWYRMIAIAAKMATAVALFACVQTPQDPDDPPPVWNPLHPGGPGYVNPNATVTTGPADGAVVTTDRATFSWQGNTSRVATYRWTLDGIADSGAAKTMTFSNLEEGAHVFTLAAKYPGDLGETPPDSVVRRTFTVSAFPKAAIYLSPRLRDVQADQQFSVEIRATRFAAVDTAKAKAVHLVLKLPAGATYAGHEVLGFLGFGGGTVLDWHAIRGDSLIIDCSRAGAVAASPADSGGVVRVHLNVGASVLATDSLRIVKCDVRNAANHTIGGVRTRGAKTVRR